MSFNTIIDKTQDLLTNAQTQFEKNCTTFTCISLSSPLITKEVKGILDKTTKSFTLSGILSHLACVPKPYVFINSSNTIFSIEEGSDILEEFVYHGKSKDMTHTITKTSIYYVSLETKRI